MPGFKQVCTFKADLSILRNALQVVNSPNGTQPYVSKFSVCVHFGRTELKAFLEWVENVMYLINMCNLPPLIDHVTPAT